MRFLWQAARFSPPRLPGKLRGGKRSMDNGHGVGSNPRNNKR